MLAGWDGTVVSGLRQAPGGEGFNAPSGFCGFTLMMLWIRLVTALLLSPIALAQELPPGTVVPIELSSGLNAKKDEAGKRIEGRVMQEVPVPGGDKINERSRISGHVVRVTKPGTSGSSIVLRFDAIEDGGRTIPLTAALLAVASMDSVADAQTPINSTSDRDPVSQWVTRQVGGDVINRGRGTAGSTRGVVGKWVRGSSVMIKLTPNPDWGARVALATTANSRFGYFRVRLAALMVYVM